MRLHRRRAGRMAGKGWSKRMKSFFSILLKGMALTLAIVCCHGGHHGICASQEDGEFHILATTFPVYLFTANVCVNAENVKVDLLIPAVSGCPHDYAPTPRDMRKLAKADVLVVNGYGLEDFLEKSLRNIAPGLDIINAGQDVPTLSAPGGVVNPHIFGAPREAAMMVENIGRMLAARNPKNADVYAANAAAYAEILKNLSARFESLGARATNRRIALEHDALQYLADNADLDIVALLEGNATAAAMAKLKKELDAARPALLAADAQYSDHSLETLARETGLPLATLNPCASGPENVPLDYYEAVMEQNLKILERHFD